MTNAALISRAKSIAASIEAMDFEDAAEQAHWIMVETNNDVSALLDILAKEGAKKRPNEKLVTGCIFLLLQGLEQLRFRIEDKDQRSTDIVSRAIKHLEALVAAKKLSVEFLLLILQQFVAAKLDMGEGLRTMMGQVIEEDASTMDEANLGALNTGFSEIAAECDHDPFAIHGLLEQSADTMPHEMRKGLAMAAFGAPEPSLREASLGFLLNSSSHARQTLLELIRLAAPKGLVTPTMLRRMIAIRNWLPKSDQAQLDTAIKTCRKHGIACAPWPAAKLGEIFVSGFDGSGAHTVIVTLQIGKKWGLAGLLVKLGFGVRDAWVQKGLSRSELKRTLNHMRSEIVVFPSGADYLGSVVGHAVGMNAGMDALPPFGLLDFAEAVGLSEVNPQPSSVDIMVAELCAGLEAERLTEKAIAETCADSENWVTEHSILQTWFEPNVASVVGAKRASTKKRIAVLLTGPLRS
ncbi:MAG TPA: hypothetical protein VNR65_05690, partial [Geobacterales bacterium]|nr:hypothetical protein [Geobacterales bacterium]